MCLQQFLQSTRITKTRYQITRSEGSSRGMVEPAVESSLQLRIEGEALYQEIYELQDSNSVNSIKVSPNGETLAYCTSSGIIKIYNFKTGELLVELTGHTKGISDLEYSPINSDIIASASDDLTIRLWSISKQKCIKILKKHTYHVTTLKFSNKGNILFSGSADETITIWDLSSGKNLKTLAAHSDPILSICLTPDNSIIVSGSYDGLMRLFDSETGQCLKTLVFNSSSYGTATASTNDVVNPPISNVEISPNGKYILSSSLDGTIRLWDYMNNKVIKTYNAIDFNNDTNEEIKICEKFNCGSKFITASKEPLVVSGSDNQGLIFWNVQTKQVVSNFRLCKGSPESPVLQIDTYDQGKTLVCCNRDGTVKVLGLNDKYIV